MTFPDDLSKSIFVALLRVNGATECELHRTASLVSHVTKRLFRVILLRVRNNVRQESQRSSMALWRIGRLEMLYL